MPLIPANAGPPGAPANPYGTYRLDAGDRVRVIVFGQDNLSRVYGIRTLDMALASSAPAA